MSTSMNHTIPIPLPENPEASGTLTRLLQAIKANGLCVVKQAVIVETESWNTYRLIEEVLAPPEPEIKQTPVVVRVPLPNGENGTHANGQENEYRIVATGQAITVGKLRQDLRFKRIEVGTQLLKTTKNGEAVMEVFVSEDGEYALRKTDVAVPAF